MTTYIYESPDGGKTIRQREFGGTLSWDWDSELGESIQGMREDQRWREIRKAARSNPTLKDLLDQAVVVYELSK